MNNWLMRDSTVPLLNACCINILLVLFSSVFMIVNKIFHLPPVMHITANLSGLVSTSLGC